MGNGRRRRCKNFATCHRTASLVCLALLCFALLPRAGGANFVLLSFCISYTYSYVLLRANEESRNPLVRRHGDEKNVVAHFPFVRPVPLRPLAVDAFWTHHFNRMSCPFRRRVRKTWEEWWLCTTDHWREGGRERERERGGRRSENWALGISSSPSCFVFTPKLSRCYFSPLSLSLSHLSRRPI